MADLQFFGMIIDGQEVPAKNGATAQSFDPATGQPWAEFPEAGEADVEAAVQAAHRAQTHGPWAQMTPTQRGKHLFALADALTAKAEEIGRLESRDTGKLLKETAWQATYIADYLRYFGGAADKLHGDTLPIDKPDMFVFTQREPLGVVAAIIPWNSQLFLSATKIGPALAAGNTIVLKASEHAPTPLLAFAKLAKEAGLPDGVINVVTGQGEPCGRALTSHPLIAKVAFTGGPTAARHVVRNSAENFASVSLELGGKSPFIVFDDAALDNAVNASVAGIFGASGQSCVAGSRLFVQRGVADEVLSRLVTIAKHIRLGPPAEDATEMGPLCTQAQIEHIEAQVAKAAAQGGKILCGGKRADREGLYFEPTIIECPSADLEIVDTELFGPVLAVQRFDGEEEVLRLANQSVHGLAAGVFTANHARAHRMSRDLQAGIVWINTYRAISPIAEFGGQKMSGYGREAGMQALYDYSRAKTVWMSLSEEPISNPFQPR